MNRFAVLSVLFLIASCRVTFGANPPTNIVSRAGDLSIVLHWDKSAEPNISGYRVYRSLNSDGPFTLQNTNLLLSPGYCDLNVTNGQTNFYQVKAVTSSLQESPPSVTWPAVSQAFTNDEEFLDYIQQVHFDYFWYLANPTNGLIPDRTASGSACSIAAVGFGLTAIGIGIDHGWITRSQGAGRVLATLNTFLLGSQGTNTVGKIGYNGWFYHFINMNSAVRSGTSELSSIDTALLLGGILYCRQYFDETNVTETSIRDAANVIVNRVDWNWMARGTNVLSLGWNPPGTFIAGNWIGYNEAMILYCLGLGAETNPLPASSWGRWTNGYTWTTYYGQTFTPFAPLFGHQYSHCWIDFRHIADQYMTSHNSTYFQNSRRASLAQRSYCIANPMGRVGYGSNLWGLTASDGPTGYNVHGAPPALNDDGTITPTAAGGSIAFTPEFSVPTLRYIYSQYRSRIWTAYGFRDAFNLGVQWYDSDELGIDQGPIVIMIENYRTQRVWRLFMRNPEVQRGLQRAGFVPLAWIVPSLQVAGDWSAVNLVWNAPATRAYQIEFSPDLQEWFASPTGEIVSAGPTANWTDTGLPGTPAPPGEVSQRFYRVFQFGPP